VKDLTKGIYQSMDWSILDKTFASQQKERWEKSIRIKATSKGNLYPWENWGREAAVGFTFIAFYPNPSSTVKLLTS
jgi:hypothetical protein